MRNTGVRNLINENGLKHWEVADALGIHEGNFSRMLRKELDEEKKAKVLEAIETAKRMKKEGVL